MVTLNIKYLMSFSGRVLGYIHNIGFINHLTSSMKTRAYFVFYCVSFICQTLNAATENGPMLSGSSTIDPFMRIVKSTGVSDLNLLITEADLSNAHKFISSGQAQDVYQKLGSYVFCVLSNDIKNGVLFKVTPSDNKNYFTEDFGVKQMTMYNKYARNKIRLILVVTPAGWTKNQHAFGNASYSDDQLKGVPFVIGTNVVNGKDASIILRDRRDTMLSSPISLPNLALDSYGIVNHYGLNVSLGEKDIKVNRLDNGSSLVFQGCNGYKNPSQQDSLVDMSINFDIYISTIDLVKANSGAYQLEFAMHWADSNDLANSVMVYGRAS